MKAILSFFAFISIFFTISAQDLCEYLDMEQRNYRRDHDYYPFYIGDENTSSQSSLQPPYNGYYRPYQSFLYNLGDTLFIHEDFEYLWEYFTHDPIDKHRLHAKHVVFPLNVKTIGSNAFLNSDLVEVNIPPSVMDIKSNAFAYCRSLESVTLGDVRVIGIECFLNCDELKWVEIPSNTRLIGNQAFWGCDLHFLQLSPLEVNPVSNFFITFGPEPIPFVACASEFLNPNLKARYQSEMPEAFDGRVMIHLKESPVPLYFSFEQTGEKEGLWQPGLDLWALTESDTTSAINGKTRLLHPIVFRPDFSLISEEQRNKLRIFYNDEDITSSLEDGKFALDRGKVFSMEDWKTGKAPTYNRLKITLEE